VEILVVDNASTDRTREVLSSWARDWGVRVMSCPVPRAPCARNYGAVRARGRILIFLDADTIMPEDALGRIVRLVDDEGYEGGFTRLAPIEDSVRARVWWTFWEHVRALPIARAKAMSALMFCTREVFQELGGFNESRTLGEEWSILAGLYARRPARFAYDRTLTAMTSSRRMELQSFGYTRVLWQYVRVVLLPSADIDYTDAIREKAA
jgi:glycosyltransferase involved in cell wall biosynthesis